jgi:hypothetical protein
MPRREWTFRIRLWLSVIANVAIFAWAMKR